MSIVDVGSLQWCDMSNVSIQIKGIDELIRKLGKVEGTKHLRQPMQRAVYRLQARMAQYPAQRPGSRYVRGQGMANAQGVVTHRTSENLGKKWTSKVEQGNAIIRGKVGNNASYAPLVQSYRFQARIHRGLWQTDRYVVDTEYRTIVRDFESAISEALR